MAMTQGDQSKNQIVESLMAPPPVVSVNQTCVGNIHTLNFSIKPHLNRGGSC